LGCTTEDSSPIRDLTLQDAGNVFRKNYDSRKTKGIYNSFCGLRIGHDSNFELGEEEDTEQFNAHTGYM
jgi:hypothetical protein